MEHHDTEPNGESRLMQEYKALLDEVAEIERDLEEDEMTGWVLGDIHEGLFERRKRLAAMERQILFEAQIEQGDR